MLEDQSKREPRCREIPEKKIDEVLAESFPASDPPPWTLGIDDHCEPPAKPEPSAGDGSK